jgi:antitoxin (DNA-binding transcriptional repressor) of toxin-antitoxin stability system
MQASVLDLRRRTREIIRALERGESVTVLYRGRRKGVIRPVAERKGKAVSVSGHPAFGMWKDRKDLRDVAAHVRALRKGRRRAL